MTQPQNMTDLVPQILWTNDVKGFANYFNQRWYEYTGLSYDESQGPGWQAISHPDDIAAVAAWEEAFQQRKVFDSEARLRNREGNYEWHLLRNIPFTDAQNNLQGWFGSATNIQRLKDEELAFRRTTSYLRAVLDTSVDFAIVNMDGNGTIIGWNRGAWIMFGYTEEEILGKPSHILFTQQDQQGGIPPKELKAALEAGRYLDERWHVRKDGSKFFMSGVVSPMKDYDGFVKITRDITDKKLGEEAMLLAENKNDVALEASHIGEWLWDLLNDRIRVDPKAQYLLGLTASEFEGKDFWAVIHPEDVHRVQKEFNKALEGLNIFQAEMRIVMNNSENGDRWINCYGRVIAHHESKPARILGVLYDISMRKAYEKQKDEFIGVASHELKTPVTTIKAYTELLYDVFEESGQAEDDGLIFKLNGQVDRLTRALHLLLDSTKLSEGALVLTTEEFDINELLSDQIEEMRHISKVHQLIFKPSTVGRIIADRDRIGQVVTNLVSNAIKYSPAGGEVIITSEDEMDGVMVTVRDFGIGLTPEERGKLFSKYYRSASHEVKLQSGFGLGLYISAQIIRQHHGLIGVESQPGQGATFYFKLFYA